jgi:hypothetical protein
MNNLTALLPTAVRAYTPPSETGSSRRFPGPGDDAPVLVLDTESTIDASQHLTFGCWRVLVDGKMVDEGLFYAEDLSEPDRATLQAYVADQNADAQTVVPLRLLSRHQFLKEVFWKIAYKSRGLVVGFNLPFDLARLGTGWGEARGNYYGGGFSLVLWGYEKHGILHENRFRSRIAIKSIDSKRALIGFRRRHQPDKVDLIPEGSLDGSPDESYAFPGHFVDPKTLGFALTNEPHSLDSACVAFDVEHAKFTVEQHGVVTPEYIDYCRRDVLATAELLDKLGAEFSRHPIKLSPKKAFSPASIGKAYLSAMGITPPLQR